jgi:hypothetical protein
MPQIFFYSIVILELPFLTVSRFCARQFINFSVRPQSTSKLDVPTSSFVGNGPKVETVEKIGKEFQHLVKEPLIVASTVSIEFDGD